MSSLYIHYKDTLAFRYKLLSGLALFIGLHIFFYFWAQPGFLGSDDLDYATIANNIRRGQFQMSPDHFYNRFGVTVPTALSYLILEVNRYSTTLWPLLCSIITIVAVFVMSFRLFGMEAAIFSSFLLATNPAQLGNSLLLLPDAVVSVFMFVSASALFFARTTECLRSKQLCGILFLLSFSFAVLSKETAIWILPFALVLMVYDLFRSENFRLWLWICLTGLFLVAFYFGGYYLLTGEPFYRLRGIEQGHNVSQHAYLGRSYIEYAKRLTYAPLLMIVQNPGYIIILTLSFPVLINPLSSVSSLPSGVGFWAGYAVTVLLSYWFGTTSFSYYNPLPLIPRMLMPMVPPLSILGGITLANLYSDDVDDTGGRWFQPALVGVAFVLVSMVVAIKYSKRQAISYAALSLPFLLLAAVLFAQKGCVLKRLLRSLRVIILASLVVVPCFNILSGFVGETSDQRAEREIVQNDLMKVSEPALIFTDPRSVIALPFYFGFSLPSNIQLIDWSGSSRSEGVGQPRLFVFINKRRIEFLNRAYGVAIPAYVYHPPPGWRLLEGRDGIYLFEIGSVCELGTAC